MSFEHALAGFEVPVALMATVSLDIRAARSGISDVAITGIALPDRGGG